MTTDLAATVRRLADRLEIEELLARYEFASDDHDFDALAECFTTDGRLRHNNGNTDVSGRDAIRDHFAKRMTSYLGLAIHLHHGHVIEFVDDDHATGMVAASGQAGTEDGLVVAALRYHDEYRREDGRWRFQSRVLHFWYRMKAQELQQMITSPLRHRHPGAPIPADLPVFERERKDVNG